jgi:hypothetical protein
MFVRCSQFRSRCSVKPTLRPCYVETFLFWLHGIFDVSLFDRDLHFHNRSLRMASQERGGAHKPHGRDTRLLIPYHGKTLAQFREFILNL